MPQTRLYLCTQSRHTWVYLFHLCQSPESMPCSCGISSDWSDTLCFKCGTCFSTICTDSVSAPLFGPLSKHLWHSPHPKYIAVVRYRKIDIALGHTALGHMYGLTHFMTFNFWVTILGQQTSWNGFAASGALWHPPNTEEFKLWLRISHTHRVWLEIEIFSQCGVCNVTQDGGSNAHSCTQWCLSPAIPPHLVQG